MGQIADDESPVRAMKRWKKLLVYGIAAILLAVFAEHFFHITLRIRSYHPDSPEIKACKKARFDFDFKRKTLKQAFKDNPLICGTYWDLIEEDGKKYVRVFCRCSGEAILKEIEKNDKKSRRSLRKMFTDAGKRNQAEQRYDVDWVLALDRLGVNYYFSVPEKKNDEFKLIKVEVDPDTVSVSLSFISFDLVKKMEKYATQFDIDYGIRHRPEKVEKIFGKDESLESKLEWIYKPRTF